MKGLLCSEAMLSVLNQCGEGNLEAADMVVYKVDGVPTLERSITYVIVVAQPHSKESESSLRTPCGLLSFAE